MPFRTVVVSPRLGSGQVPGPGLRVEVVAHPDRVVALPGYVMLPADDPSSWPVESADGEYRLTLPTTPEGSSWAWVLGARVLDQYDRVIAEIPEGTYLLPEGDEVALTELVPVVAPPTDPPLSVGLAPWPEDPAFFYVPQGV
ncbi:hypothetical protein [Clavibacter capsici]|uniref:hypothetical protein n=1 Tax=Clavibacter capsici TaxID=1874630 RepID=UPI0014287307|nr:hypothetical protein [Clavibacter capsici]QIS38597.1 hypothetical protein GW572_04280 [Clavibacter capsici]